MDTSSLEVFTVTVTGWKAKAVVSVVLAGVFALGFWAGRTY